MHSIKLSLSTLSLSTGLSFSFLSHVFFSSSAVCIQSMHGNCHTSNYTIEKRVFFSLLLLRALKMKNELNMNGKRRNKCGRVHHQWVTQWERFLFLSRCKKSFESKTVRWLLSRLKKTRSINSSSSSSTRYNNNSIININTIANNRHANVAAETKSPLYSQNKIHFHFIATKTERKTHAHTMWNNVVYKDIFIQWK